MNVYIIATQAINFLTTILLAIFVFAVNPFSPINQTYALANLSVSFWSFFYVLWQLSQNYQSAYDFLKLLMYGATFMPVFLIHFLLNYCGKMQQKKYVLPFIYLLGFIFLLAIRNDLLFDKLKHKLTFIFWPDAGPMMVPFLLFFFLIIAYAMFQLLNKYITSKGFERNRDKYLFIALLVAILAGSPNYALWFDIKFPPVLNPLFSVYVGIIAYAILRYRLMDIEVVIKRSFVFTALTALIVGVYALGTFVLQDIFGNLIGLKWLLAVIGSALIAVGFKPLETAFTNFTDRYFFKAKYDYHATLKQLSQGMAELTNLGRLTRLMVRIMIRNIKIQGAMLFIYDYNQRNFRAASAQGIMKEFEGSTLKMNDTLVKFMDQRSDILVRDDIEHELEDQRIVNSYRKDVTQMLKDMEYYGAVLCVPSKIKDKLIGFLLLGEKKSQDAYSSEDILLFQTLAPQAAIAIKNAMTYDEIRQDLEKEHGRLETVEKQLERSERLASLGTLAAGVAHEIRNPLQALRLKAEGIAEKSGDASYVKDAADTVIRNTDRVLAITKEMLDLSKQKEPEKKPFNVNEMLESVLRFVNTGPKISMVKDLGQLPAITGDATRISQVVINLIENAVKAMPDGGTLTVRSYNDGTAACIEVADTGVGIPKDNLERIFDPFFTTHAESTGLGLAISYRIVREHGGSIKVKSEVGKGSIFTVSLPLSS